MIRSKEISLKLCINYFNSKLEYLKKLNSHYQVLRDQVNQEKALRADILFQNMEKFIKM